MHRTQTEHPIFLFSLVSAKLIFVWGEFSRHGPELVPLNKLFKIDWLYHESLAIMIVEIFMEADIFNFILSYCIKRTEFFSQDRYAYKKQRYGGIVEKKS